MPSDIRGALASEAPDWVQALFFAAFVLFAVAGTTFAATDIFATDGDASVIAGIAAGTVAAVAYFPRARGWFRVLREYVNAASRRTGRPASELMAITFSHRGPGFMTVMATHAMLVLLLAFPLGYLNSAYLMHKNIEFERDIERSMVVLDSEPNPTDPDLARPYEASMATDLIVGAALLALWAPLASFILSRPRAGIARALRRASRLAEGRSQAIEAAIDAAVEAGCLPAAV